MKKMYIYNFLLTKESKLKMTTFQELNTNIYIYVCAYMFYHEKRNSVWVKITENDVFPSPHPNNIKWKIINDGFL